jgi:formate dehydrogenase subunit delta
VSNTHDTLVRMANQIAANLAPMASDAAAATADHIASFWDPRMKAQIFADTHGLSPLALQAIDILRQNAHPPHQTRATEFPTGNQVGGSDAG